MTKEYDMKFRQEDLDTIAALRDDIRQYDDLIARSKEDPDVAADQLMVADAIVGGVRRLLEIR